MAETTIRNVESSVSARLKQEAKDQGKSVNQFIFDMIEQNPGFKKKKKYTNNHNDLDHLFGKWSDEDHNRIQGGINPDRKNAKELWE